MSNDYPIQRKLRNIFVNPKLQSKILFYFIGLYILSTASLYSANYFFVWRLNQKALNVGIPEGHVFFKFMSAQKHDMDMMFMTIALINLLLLLVVATWVSHRIAGPLNKIKKHLSSLDKESDILRLRDNDFLKDMEPTINSLKDKVK